METLIKSPPISDRGIDLLPLGQIPDKATHLLRAPEILRPGQPPVAPTQRNKPVNSPAPSQPDVATSAPSEAPEEQERRTKELLAAQQASLKAIEEGFAKGLAEGKRTAEGKYAEALDALAKLAENGRDSVSGLLRDAEEVIGAIVFEAVCKIVGKDLASQEGRFAVVQQVLASAMQEEVVSIRVSPKDCHSLKAQHPALPIEPDDRIELGGCILALKGGSIDGRIETQFRVFAQGLKDALRER